MKRLLSFLLLSSALMANDIQVFTSNSTHLVLDKGSQIKEVFFGTEEAFKAQSDSFKKAGGSILSGFADLGNAGGAGAAGAAGGAIAVLASAALIEGYNSIVSDNNYVLISEATASNGHSTMLKTLVITNYSIPLEEAKSLATSAQKNLIK